MHPFVWTWIPRSSPPWGHNRGAILWHLQISVPSQAIGVPGDLHQVAVMEQAIRDGRGRRSIPEDLPPLAETLVRDQQGRVPLIAPVDQLEEKIDLRSTRVPLWLIGR